MKGIAAISVLVLVALGGCHSCLSAFDPTGSIVTGSTASPTKRHVSPRPAHRRRPIARARTARLVTANAHQPTSGSQIIAGAAQPTNATTDQPMSSQRLIAEGQGLLAAGRVIEARTRFVTAMNAQSAEATLALARSYDTFYLVHLQSSDGAPDMQRALQLYAVAAQRNVPEADADLRRVRALYLRTRQ